MTSPVKDEPVVEPLYPEFLEAAERIRQEGWWQDTDAGAKGQFCLMHAAVGISARPPELQQAAALLGFRGFAEAFTWNDAPGRTLAEVLERLTLAAYGEFE